MKTATALLIKLVGTFLFAWVGLTLIDGNTAGWVLATAVIATAANYLVGDLFTLPNYGNMVASVGDGVMAALTAYIMSLIVGPISVSLLGVLVFGALVAVGEYFFHNYLRESEEVAP